MWCLSVVCADSLMMQYGGAFALLQNMGKGPSSEKSHSSQVNSCAPHHNFCTLPVVWVPAIWFCSVPLHLTCAVGFCTVLLLFVSALDLMRDV